MAKITIAGQAVVVTSTLKLEDIGMVAKYRPETLTLKDEEGEPIFAIATCKGCGSISTYGAEFGHSNAEGFAQITLGATIGDEEDLKAFVAEEIGRPVLKLNKLEEQLPTVIREIEAEKADILRNITVVE